MIAALSEKLIYSLPFEVYVVDRHGDLVYANERFLSRSGYSFTELITLSIFDTRHHLTEEGWGKFWTHLYQRKNITHKAVHVTKSGELYEVEIIAQLFSNRLEQLVYIFANDITESSFSRYVLEATEHLTNIGGWKLNQSDNSLIVSKQCYEIFGVKKKEDFFPKEIIHQFRDPVRLRELFSGLLQYGMPYDVVMETIHQPRKFIRCIAKPIWREKRMFKFIGAYQDVTDNQSKQNSLKLYLKVINQADDMIFIYNRCGELVYSNQSAKFLLAGPDEDLNSSSFFDFDKNATLSWWEKLYKDMIQNGSSRFEWNVNRYDGVEFQLDIKVNHLQYDGEDLMCAIMRDISERKKNEKALEDAFEEIKSLKDRIESENEYLQEEIKTNLNFGNIICASDSYRKVLELVQKVAPTDSTVLITGESGTGKELLATALHNQSSRNQRPLIKVNCAALPKELIESELFGHKKGAFTGAIENKQGKFALANGGTIFLDEIGELPIDLQPKLLRVLQEGEFDVLGGQKTMKVDVRVIAATNRKLEKMVTEGLFREDLYYRLNVFPILSIPLRERKEDIPLLAQYFLEKYTLKAGKSFKRLSKRTIESLIEYDFPGNIRELENLIERAVITENGSTLMPGDWLPTPAKFPLIDSEFVSFEEMQRKYIVEVLTSTQWRVSGPKGAAHILKMNDKTLHAKMKRLGINKAISLKED